VRHTATRDSGMFVIDRASVKAAVYARLRANGAFRDDVVVDDDCDGVNATCGGDEDDVDGDCLRWARASLTRLPSSSSSSSSFIIHASVDDETRVMHYVFSYWRALSALPR
jgi:hypothetical protein